MVDGISYMVYEHKDPTNHGLWNSPHLGPWSQKVGSVCLHGLWGPYIYDLSLSLSLSLTLFLSLYICGKILCRNYIRCLLKGYGAPRPCELMGGLPNDVHLLRAVDLQNALLSAAKLASGQPSSWLTEHLAYDVEALEVDPDSEACLG